MMAALLTWTAATVACAGKHAPTAMASPPALVIGEFVDDDGSRYTITPEEWFHQPAIRYRVVKWNLDQQSLHRAERSDQHAIGHRVDQDRLDAAAGYGSVRVGVLPELV